MVSSTPIPSAMAAITEIVTPMGMLSQPMVPKKMSTATMFGNNAITPIFQERKSEERMTKITAKARKTLWICPWAMLLADSLVSTCPPVKLTERCGSILGIFSFSSSLSSRKAVEPLTRIRMVTSSSCSFSSRKAGPSLFRISAKNRSTSVSVKRSIPER